MSEIFQVSIVRHTKNYEAMVQFYRDGLGMGITQSWEEPGNRGTLLSFGGKTTNSVIEVLELGDEAVPGVKPINVVLSIEVSAVDEFLRLLIEFGCTCRHVEYDQFPENHVYIIAQKAR